MNDNDYYCIRIIKYFLNETITHLIINPAILIAHVPLNYSIHYHKILLKKGNWLAFCFLVNTSLHIQTEKEMNSVCMDAYCSHPYFVRRKFKFFSFF